MTPTDPRILALTDALAAMHKRATEAEERRTDRALFQMQEAAKDLAAKLTAAESEAADLRAKLTAAEERLAESVKAGVIDSLRSELAALTAERDRLIASEGNIARERAQAEAEEERLAGEVARLKATPAVATFDLPALEWADDGDGAEAHGADEGKKAGSSAATWPDGAWEFSVWGDYFLTREAAEGRARLCNGGRPLNAAPDGQSDDERWACVDTQAAPPPPKAPAPAPGIDAARLLAVYEEERRAGRYDDLSPARVEAMRRALATVGATAPREVTAKMLAEALTLTWPKTYVGRGALADMEANDLLHHLGRVSLSAVDMVTVAEIVNAVNCRIDPASWGADIEAAVQFALLSFVGKVIAAQVTP